MGNVPFEKAEFGEESREKRNDGLQIKGRGPTSKNKILALPFNPDQLTLVAIDKY